MPKEVVKGYVLAHNVWTTVRGMTTTECRACCPPQIMVVVNLVIYVGDVLVVQLRSERNRGGTFDNRVQCVYDVAITASVLVLIFVRLRDMIGSEQTTQDTTGKLATINWDLPDLSPLVCPADSVGMRTGITPCVRTLMRRIGGVMTPLAPPVSYNL
eukprot:1455561-Pyramimonas_sp.AAC.1